MLKSDLPFGSEFSPSQINLPDLLELAKEHSGNNEALQGAILAGYFATHAGGNKQNQNTLAMNCRLGMKAYGLIDEDGVLTAFGQVLYDRKSNEELLYTELARHILLNLKGMAFIQCIQDMIVTGEEVTLTSLRAALTERGIHYPSGGKHPSIMRLWLAKARIFIGARWQVDEVRLNEILGTSSSTFGELAFLTLEQRDFLRALANTGSDIPQSASAVARLATATYGTKFPEKSLPKLVLNDLEAAGYITLTKTTEGRGSKPFLVQPTEKLKTELIEPLLEQIKNQTDPKLVGLLRKPLAAILAEIDAEDKQIRGLALEAMAFKLMRLLDMDYVATRLRGHETGGAEIDVVFQSTRLIFSRWQVQCKNTQAVSLDDVAKEVGLTHFLKSNAIVIVSTGKIGGEARRYANKVMKDSNLCIVMVDFADLASIREDPSHIVSVFNREARFAMTLKKLDTGA